MNLGGSNEIDIVKTHILQDNPQRSIYYITSVGGYEMKELNINNYIVQLDDADYDVISKMSGWDISKVRKMKHIFDNCPIEEKYKPNFGI